MYSKFCIEGSVQYHEDHASHNTSNSVSGPIREISLENVMEIYESPPLDDPYNLVYWTFCSISAVSWLPSHVLMMNIEWFYPNESLQHLTTLFYWYVLHQSYT